MTKVIDEIRPTELRWKMFTGVLKMAGISKTTLVSEILERYPAARQVFDRHGLHGCGGNLGPAETLEFFARVHEADVEALLTEIQVEISKMVMLPLFPVYGILNHQYFAHSFMGAYRHALTVGFVTLMIMGIAARVVPILAGIDSSRLDALWGPFILLNIGNSDRVILQILTDFIPRIAYPLVGFTAFIEVTAITWWGIELWRVMNTSRASRPAPVLIQPRAAAS